MASDAVSRHLFCFRQDALTTSRLELDVQFPSWYRPDTPTGVPNDANTTSEMTLYAGQVNDR